ncbi:MAG: adenylate cyclase, partial [Neisseriaceae bacterium]|nr:adenylate cyclase [Neisseriaceae bacterium]
MSIEIERRFLLKNNDWQKEISQSIKMQQGYMSVEKECTIRVRIIDNHAWITIKGFISNISRHEFEYPVPVKDAQVMLNELCAFSLQKTRHII